MATKRIIGLVIATGGVTVGSVTGLHLHKRREKKLDDLVHSYRNSIYRVEVSFKDLEKVAPMFDSINEEYVDIGEMDACIGGSTALKLYTKKDFTPSDVDIFTTTHNVSHEKNVEEIEKVLGVDNVKFIPKELTEYETFNNQITDVTQFDYIKTTPPIKTQIIHVEKPLTTIANWYIAYSDMNICITKFDDHYVFQFPSQHNADMIRDGYLHLLENKREAKYKKYRFVTDFDMCARYSLVLNKKYRDNLKVPFFSW